MNYINLIISDETLRDGEQQVGVNFTNKEKFIIAKNINKIGVKQISVMPIISKDEKNLSQKLLSSKLKNNLWASTMLDKKFVDYSYKLGFRKIILFASLSDRLLKIRNITKKENIKQAVFVCRYAKNKGIEIIFAGEDATRANKKFLLKFILSIKKYINGFILCDTVGVLTPLKTKKLVKDVIKKTKCNIGIHCHNDRGFADINSVVAIKSGATILSATFGGIGERAGNADICNVLLKLKKSGLLVNDIDYSNLIKTKKLVYHLGGLKPAKPYSSRAFWHESGIHINALLKDNLSYNSFLPEKYNKHNRFFFGKFSGTSSYKYIFNNKFNENQLIAIRDEVKKLSQKNQKSFTKNEIIKMFN